MGEIFNKIEERRLMLCGHAVKGKENYVGRKVLGIELQVKHRNEEKKKMM